MKNTGKPEGFLKRWIRKLFPSRTSPQATTEPLSIPTVQTVASQPRMKHVKMKRAAPRRMPVRRNASGVAAAVQFVRARRLESNRNRPRRAKRSVNPKKIRRQIRTHGVTL